MSYGDWVIDLGIISKQKQFLSNLGNLLKFERHWVESSGKSLYFQATEIAPIVYFLPGKSVVI